MTRNECVSKNNVKCILIIVLIFLFLVLCKCSPCVYRHTSRSFICGISFTERKEASGERERERERERGEGGRGGGGEEGRNERGLGKEDGSGVVMVEGQRELHVRKIMT